MKKITRCGLITSLFCWLLLFSQIKVFAAINMDQAPFNLIPAIREAIQSTAEQVQSRIYRQPVSDTIQFLNGDTLHGALISIEGLNYVVWQSPNAKSNIEFYTTNISEISLARKEIQTNRPTTCVVKLVNGDELPGELKELNESELMLDTWYGGKLKVNRNVIKSLMFTRERGGCIFDGPTGLDGWFTGRGRIGWKYSDGAFVANRPGIIGRDMKLPNRIKISYDLAWQGGTFFLMTIFADNPEDLYSNCYMLQFNSGYINLQRIRRNSGSRNLGQVELLSLNEKSKAKIEVYADREKGLVALFVDGSFVKQWKDNNEIPMTGTCMHFQQQSGSMVKISNLRVEEWDGRLDTRIDADNAAVENDLVELVNHDKLSGKLLYIKSDKLKFATSFAEMEIPLERVYSFELSSKNSSKIERKKDEIVATFIGRGSVSFKPQKWDKSAVIGKSQGFGEFKFIPEAFSRITFNIQLSNPEPEIVEPNDEGEQ